MASKPRCKTLYSGTVFQRKLKQEGDLAHWASGVYSTSNDESKALNCEVVLFAMSPARWFILPWYLMAHLIGGIFAFPLALMFMNYAHKRRFKHGKSDEKIT